MGIQAGPVFLGDFGQHQKQHFRLLIQVNQEAGPQQEGSPHQGGIMVRQHHGALPAVGGQALAKAVQFIIKAYAFGRYLTIDQHVEGVAWSVEGGNILADVLFFGKVV
ncbi:hypothetical protein DFAR_170001 [Desulfarculales bacterium]